MKLDFFNCSKMWLNKELPFTQNNCFIVGIIFNTLCFVKLCHQVSMSIHFSFHDNSILFYFDMVTIVMCCFCLQGWRWVPVYHHYLQHLHQSGPVCPLLVLLCHTRPPEPVWTSVEVLYSQICHFPFLLAR